MYRRWVQLSVEREFHVGWYPKLTSSPLSNASRISSIVISPGPAVPTSSSVGSLPSLFRNLMRARITPPNFPFSICSVHSFLVLDTLATVRSTGKGATQVYLFRLHYPFFERQWITGLDVVLPHILPERMRFRFDPHQDPHILVGPLFTGVAHPQTRRSWQ